MLGFTSGLSRLTFISILCFNFTIEGSTAILLIENLEQKVLFDLFTYLYSHICTKNILILVKKLKCGGSSGQQFESGTKILHV